METREKVNPGKEMRATDITRFTPFLWFNNQAEEAVHFYTSVFKNSAIETATRYGKEGSDISGMPEGTVMTVAFRIEGQEFVAINGGPVFVFTPAVSFFVNCDKEQEIDALWEKLKAGGTVLMELDKYPFSEKYGWVQDKYGISWQLILPGRKQKIATCLMFTGEQHLKAEEAIKFYCSVFPHSDIIQLERYKAGEGPEGAIVHSKFTLSGEEFIAMDSHQNLPYAFNPAISMVVNCRTQEEVDHFWEKLSAGGNPQAQQCGWLQDMYGFSWQIIPVVLGELLSDPDPGKSGRVMQAMLQMKKIDIKVLREAYMQH